MDTHFPISRIGFQVEFPSRNVYFPSLDFDASYWNNKPAAGGAVAVVAGVVVDVLAKLNPPEMNLIKQKLTTF